MNFRVIFLLSLSSLLFSCTVGPKKNSIIFSKNFNAAQESLILSGDSSLPMRVLKINNLKDSLVLRSNSEWVNPNPEDKSLQQFCNRLLATVQDSNSLGVGIAAPQVGILKKIPITIDGLMGLDRAVLADGGVKLDEVDTRTMRSKKLDNLFLTGDMLHVNRPSGGYSLQLCWTTGYVAGMNA